MSSRGPQPALRRGAAPCGGGGGTGERSGMFDVALEGGGGGGERLRRRLMEGGWGVSSGWDCGTVKSHN